MMNAQIGTATTDTAHTVESFNLDLSVSPPQWRIPVLPRRLAVREAAMVHWNLSRADKRDTRTIGLLKATGMIGKYMRLAVGPVSYSPVKPWHCGQALNDGSNCRNAAVMFGDCKSRYCEPCANAYQEYMIHKMNN